MICYKKVICCHLTVEIFNHNVFGHLTYIRSTRLISPRIELSHDTTWVFVQLGLALMCWVIATRLGKIACGLLRFIRNVTC